MKDTGRTTRQVGRASSPTSMAMSTKETGKMIKLVGLECTRMRRLMPGMKDTGRMICNMALGFKSMQMEIATKACSTKEKGMERANIFSLTARCTMESG